MNRSLLICLLGLMISGKCFAEADSRVARQTNHPPKADVPAQEARSNLSRGTVDVDLESGVITTSTGMKIPFVNPADELEMRELERANSGLSELELFATADHPHGFSMEDAEKFQGHDISGLFRMLREDQYREHWNSIAVLIGAVGGNGAINELLAYYEDESMQSESAVSAKLSALQALGILAGRHNSTETLRHLAEALWIEKWLSRKDIAAIDHYDYAALGVKAALKGIALSGSDAAPRLFKDFQGRLDSNPALRDRMVKKDVNSQFIHASLSRAEMAKGRDYFEAEKLYRSMQTHAQTK